MAAAVAILRTFFGVLAYESDMEYWDGRQNFKGVSLMTLYANIVALVVTSLHLLQNGAPLLFIALHLIGVGIELWKLNTASRAGSQRYVDSGTKSFDSKAMKLLSGAFVALMVI